MYQILCVIGMQNKLNEKKLAHLGIYSALKRNGLAQTVSKMIKKKKLLFSIMGISLILNKHKLPFAYHLGKIIFESKYSNKRKQILNLN